MLAASPEVFGGRLLTVCALGAPESPWCAENQSIPTRFASIVFFGTLEKNVCPRLFDAATMALVFVFGSVRVVKVPDDEPCTLQCFQLAY